MKRLLTFLIVSLLLLTSCEKDLDINIDPNTPPQITKGLALSAAQGSLVTVVGGELFNLGGMYGQFYTQSPSAGQYDEMDQYNLNTDYANRFWTELYSGALQDLHYVQEESLEDGDTGSYLIATVLKAYTFQYLVDIFGDIPYEEALKGIENISPAPTSGEEVYEDLIASINLAIENYEKDPVDNGVLKQDLVYGGDISKWIEFANTLKLRMYMRVSGTSMASPEKVMELLNEGNFLTENAAFSAFSDATGKRHPYYEVQIEYLGNINTIASNSLHEYLRINEDPRLGSIYQPNAKDEFIGLDQGLGLSVEYGGYKATNFSRPDITPTTPVFLMTVAESKFLQAEALVRYAGGTGAEEKYEEGILSSFALHGLSIEQAESLISNGGPYKFESGGIPEEKLEQIALQKWVSLANANNLEAWIETIRTGYPILSESANPQYGEGRRIVSVASVLPGLQMPQSLFYPDEEVQRNRNLKQKATLMEKVWWNQ